jgi:hypothetical protein
MSGHNAAKWCESRIATAAMPCCRALSRSSSGLACKAGWAKPSAASAATSPGAASITTGTARPATPTALQRRDIAGQPQEPMAEAAIAFGDDDGPGQRDRIVLRDANSGKNFLGMSPARHRRRSVRELASHTAAARSRGAAAGQRGMGLHSPRPPQNRRRLITLAFCGPPQTAAEPPHRSATQLISMGYG